MSRGRRRVGPVRERVMIWQRNLVTEDLGLMANGVFIPNMAVMQLHGLLSFPVERSSTFSVGAIPIESGAAKVDGLREEG